MKTSDWKKDLSAIKKEMRNQMTPEEKEREKTTKTKRTGKKRVSKENTRSL